MRGAANFHLCTSVTFRSNISRWRGKNIFFSLCLSPGNSVCPKPQFFLLLAASNWFLKANPGDLATPSQNMYHIKIQESLMKKAVAVSLVPMDFCFSSLFICCFFWNHLFMLRDAGGSIKPFTTDVSPRGWNCHKAINILVLTNVFATKLVSHCQVLAFSKCSSVENQNQKCFLQYRRRVLPSKIKANSFKSDL